MTNSESMKHPGGRPLRFKTVKDFKSKTSGWNTEKEFVDFIEHNLETFCHDVLKESYALHKREWYLCGLKTFGANKPRIDLMVETTTGRRVGIECKRPYQTFADLSRALSQLLSYATLAEMNGYPLDVLYILTTEYNEILEMVIQKYELPIKVIVFSRYQRAEMQ